MKKNIIKFGLAVAISLVLPSCEQPEFLSNENPTNVNRSSAKVDGSNMVSNEVLIKFKNGTSESKKTEILGKLGGKLKEKVLRELLKTTYFSGFPFCTGFDKFISCYFFTSFS